MNYLEKLLGGANVEWVKLGELTDINTGQKPTFISNVPTNFDYINAGTIRSGYCEQSNCEGDTVTTPSRGQGGIGYVDYQTNSFWLGPLCYKLKSKDKNILINKYLFYYLQSDNQLILNLKKEGGVPAVNKSDLASILIPIPCPDNSIKSLEIQKKIVKILDTFTELTAELTTRKKQYSYYREQLLRFDEGEVEHIPMGDERIGEFERGKRFVKDDIVSEGVPCIHYGEMYTHYGIWANHSKSFLTEELVETKKLRVAEKGDVVIVAAGETIEDIGRGTAWLGDEGVVIMTLAFFTEAH